MIKRFFICQTAWLIRLVPTFIVRLWPFQSILCSKPWRFGVGFSRRGSLHGKKSASRALAVLDCAGLAVLSTWQTQSKAAEGCRTPKPGESLGNLWAGRCRGPLPNRFPTHPIECLNFAQSVSRNGMKIPAQIAIGSFSACCMDAIAKKKCCQMPRIFLFSPSIAPRGAGANSLLPCSSRHKTKKTLTNNIGGTR